MRAIRGVDYEGGAARRDGRQLVAERFAGAGGHDEQDVAAGDDGLADGFLAWAEGGGAEGGLEEVGEGSVGGRSLTVAALIGVAGWCGGGVVGVEGLLIGGGLAVRVGGGRV